MIWIELALSKEPQGFTWGLLNFWGLPWALDALAMSESAFGPWLRPSPALQTMWIELLVVGLHRKILNFQLPEFFADLWTISLEDTGYVIIAFELPGEKPQTTAISSNSRWIMMRKPDPLFNIFGLFAGCDDWSVNPDMAIGYVLQS